MIQNKKLITTGRTFEIGAAILVDGEKQKKTANDVSDDVEWFGRRNDLLKRG